MEILVWSDHCKDVWPVRRLNATVASSYFRRRIDGNFYSNTVRDLMLAGV